MTRPRLIIPRPREQVEILTLGVDVFRRGYRVQVGVESDRYLDQRFATIMCRFQAGYAHPCALFTKLLLHPHLLIRSLGLFDRNVAIVVGVDAIELFLRARELVA